MGAGLRTDFAAPDGLPGVPLSRDDGGAAGTSSQGPPAVPPPALLPGMAAILRDLRWDFGAQFSLAAHVTDDLRECWTAARHDALGHFTAGSHEALLDWIHGEMDTLPVAAQFAYSDRLLERFQGRHPGWCVVTDGEGFRAYRGEDELRATSLGELEKAISGLVSA